MRGAGRGAERRARGAERGAALVSGAEHAVLPGQGRRRAPPVSGPLALLLAGRAGGPGPAAVVGGGRPPLPAGRAPAARAADPGGAEDENVAEEALQGLLLRPAARPALRLLQDQPPAQAAEAVAPRPGRREPPGAPPDPGC